MVIDLGLSSPIYEGCKVEMIGGRQTLITSPENSMNIIGQNTNKLVSEANDRVKVTLTGPMAVWAYLVVFHQVVHRFGEVWYEDGRNPPLLIAKH
jgi:hypothetical protein